MCLSASYKLKVYNLWHSRHSYYTVLTQMPGNKNSSSSSSSSKAPKPKRVKSRNWCFTLNNYKDEDLQRLDKFCQEHPDVYLLYGKEKGAEGTPHLQGYWNLPVPQAASYIKKLVPRAHIEKCKGTPAENIAYCSKEREVTSYGTEPTTQQERNKAKQKKLLDYAKKGEISKIQEEFPGQYLSQYRNIHQIMTDNMVKPPDLEETCGIWIHGRTGCGKTTKARTEYGTYYSKPCNKWWDGYQGEDCVILEDMDPNHSKLAHHLKLWTDKWSFTAEVKGGTRTLRPKKVIITSQYTIHQVFSEEGPEAVEALERRCKIIDMDNPVDHMAQPEEDMEDITAILERYNEKGEVGDDE